MLSGDELAKIIGAVAALLSGLGVAAWFQQRREPKKEPYEEKLETIENLIHQITKELDALDNIEEHQGYLRNMHQEFRILHQERAREIREVRDRLVDLEAYVKARRNGN